MWKQVKKFPNYECNKLGQIRNKKTKKVLKPYRVDYRDNYQCLTLMKDKIKFRVKVHRIIAETLIGNIEGLEVDHIDFNPKNNQLSNLQILTRVENLARRR